jgi:cell wall-associated NlpC family hydrolase
MRRLRALFLGGVVAALALVPLTAAVADPTTDLSIQAATLATQIETANEQISALGEQYDGAQLRLQQAQQNLANFQADIAPIKARIDELKAAIASRAASNYRAELGGSSTSALDATNAEELSVRNRYAASQAAVDNGNFEQLSAEERLLAQEQHEAEQAHADAEAAQASLTTTRQQLAAANQQRVVLLSNVQGQLALVLPTEEGRRQAAELALALAEFAPGIADGGIPSLFPGLPAVSPSAAIAIGFAQAQIGKPYVYAAAGPNSYDCSGLVMAAFAFAGVQLPHYSGAQYAMLPHVPLTAVQPGDLLFWGDAASEHVAIYVGAGRILEAGGTGDDVHIGPIWGHPFGAARVP